MKDEEYNKIKDSLNFQRAIQVWLIIANIFILNFYIKTQYQDLMALMLMGIWLIVMFLGTCGLLIRDESKILLYKDYIQKTKKLKVERKLKKLEKNRAVLEKEKVSLGKYITNDVR